MHEDNYTTVDRKTLLKPHWVSSHSSVSKTQLFILKFHRMFQWQIADQRHMNLLVIELEIICTSTDIEYLGLVCNIATHIFMHKIKWGLHEAINWLTETKYSGVRAITSLSYSIVSKAP